MIGLCLSWQEAEVTLSELAKVIMALVAAIKHYYVAALLPYEYWLILKRIFIHERDWNGQDRSASEKEDANKHQTTKIQADNGLPFSCIFKLGDDFASQAPEARSSWRRGLLIWFAVR